MKESIKLVKNKKSIFMKFRKFINILSKIKKNNKIQDEKISSFEDFLLKVDKKNNNLYTIVKNIICFCEEAIEIVKKRLVIIKKVQVLEEEIKELQCYKDLPEKSMEELKKLITRFESLNKDKSDLRNQIVNFDKGLLEMDKLEKDAEFILKNVEEAEKKKRILNHDVSYLKGEKLDLELEREELINLRNIISKFYVYSIIIFSIIFVFLGFLRIFKENNVLFSFSIFSILVIFIMVGIFLLKEKIKKELIINLKKQHKAVELLNKKNTVYVYYTSFLNFIYNKYNVKNANKLKQNIREYETYKNVTIRFDSVKESLYKTEQEIEEFLKNNKIKNSILTIEKFAKTMDIEDKRKYYEDLYLEKSRLEKKLIKLDKIYKKIWDEILALNNKDKSKNKITDSIIEKYLDEVNKLTSINDDYQNKEKIKNTGKDIEEILIEDK